MTHAPNSQELDDHLKEVIHSLHGAVRQGISHLNDPGGADRAIRDCGEILDEILAGKTAEWLQRDEG